MYSLDAGQGQRKAQRRGGKAGGFIPVSACANPDLKACFASNGFDETYILTCWSDVVGTQIAQYCIPLKLKWPTGAHRAGKGVLYLGISSARALEAQYHTCSIIKKVNAYYGYQAITELRFNQGLGPDRKPLERPSKPVLSDQQSQQLSHCIQDVASHRLRTALEKLGQHVLACEEHAKR